MNPICFYHKADLDGVCSAAIVKHFVPECELYGIDYGDVFPWDKTAPEHLSKDEHGIPYDAVKRDVYMVDFSIPYDDMVRLKNCSNFVWIDHHKTAIAEMHGCELKGLRYDGLAACELCWTYFDQGTGSIVERILAENLSALAARRPDAVRLLGRYDVFDKSDPVVWSSDILPFQYGLRSFSGYGMLNPEDGNWPGLLGVKPVHEGLEHLIEFVKGRGLAVLEYNRQEYVQQLARGVFTAVIALKGFGLSPKCPDDVRDYRAICLNTATIGSRSFDTVWDPDKHDIMVAFHQRSDGSWRHGIYSETPEVDCSIIAKCFGGGGHAGAAGCVTDEPIVSPGNVKVVERTLKSGTP